MLYVRRSTEQDMERIMEIYAYARQFMAAHGNPNQWGPTNWPPEALIRSDIEGGNSYVCVEVGAKDGAQHSDGTLQTSGMAQSDDMIQSDENVKQPYAGRVAGTFFFRQGKDAEPGYRHIEDGKWLDDSPYGVVHRVAADGSVKGIGSFCLNWAYERCGHLRIDTHGDNLVMQALLSKLGFVRCGTIYVEEDDNPRIAYEKV